MTQHILIVDDEESIRVALQRLLEYNGFDARVAEDGFRALESLAEDPADVVLLDIKMPRMDGLEVLQKIRERPDGPFVVIVTAHGDTQTAVECMKLGADDYLEKPWEQERLLSIIRGEVCSCCKTTLPPQLCIQVRKGLVLESCPSCSRLLVHEETTRAPAPPTT